MRRGKEGKKNDRRRERGGWERVGGGRKRGRKVEGGKGKMEGTIGGGRGSRGEEIAERVIIVT